ncbi:MAG: hypothetical protein K1X88_11090 [Nannocystaceae bacterium]|nr:hypothetical protein [Nannocystaceae bacterium]
MAGARWPTLVLFGPAVAWLALATAGSAAALLDGDDWGPPARRDATVAGADACRRCHLPQWRSWHDSYHRTMTQPTAAPGFEPAAPFAGERLAALGFVATLSRDGDGRPHVRVVPEAGDDAGGTPLLDARVELAVGSHRVQQYVARLDRGGGEGELWRLPLAWHIGEARWIHLNTAFLAPDGEPGSEADFMRHLSRYNDNCLFCHNTEPNPGLAADGRWHSAVGQWGIACEACHGPAAAHVQRHDAPLRRVWSALGDDGTVVDPQALAPGLATDVCGRCHGQRIGHDIATILAHGDGFRPGEPLANVSRPILRDATVGDDPQPHFRGRFWPDGSARLSAHEYQALLASPCHQDGAGLQCGDCHAMHGPTPAMQLRSDWDPTRSCTRCHDALALSGATAPAGHGGHGDALDCVACHMPRTSYGLLQGMISHRIGSPDPAAAVGLHDRPDACTQCHVDRSRSWAVASLPALGLPAHAPARAEDPRERWGSRILLDLHGGDPIQRALAVDALARPDAPVDPRVRLSWLLDALVDDYAAVRFMAWVGARALAAESGLDAAVTDALAGFDPEAAVQTRLATWQQLRRALGPGPFDDAPERALELEASRDAVAIWIGE